MTRQVTVESDSVRNDKNRLESRFGDRHDSIDPPQYEKVFQHGSRRRRRN